MHIGSFFSLLKRLYVRASVQPRSLAHQTAIFVCCKATYIGKDKLTDILCEMIEFGQKVSAVDYNTALEGRELLNTGLNAVFEFYDIIITPAAARPMTSPAQTPMPPNPQVNPSR